MSDIFSQNSSDFVHLNTKSEYTTRCGQFFSKLIQILSFAYLGLKISILIQRDGDNLLSVVSINHPDRIPVVAFNELEYVPVFSVEHHDLKGVDFQNEEIR